MKDSQRKAMFAMKSHGKELTEEDLRKHYGSNMARMSVKGLVQMRKYDDRIEQFGKEAKQKTKFDWDDLSKKLSDAEQDDDERYPSKVITLGTRSILPYPNPQDKIQKEKNTEWWIRARLKVRNKFGQNSNIRLDGDNIVVNRPVKKSEYNPKRSDMVFVHNQSGRVHNPVGYKHLKSKWLEANRR